MKHMPYRIPDGFFEKSKTANRAAIRMRNGGMRTDKRVSHWAVSIAAAAACLTVCIFAYSEFGNHHTEFDDLIAQMQNASDELIYEISSDAVEYPEDINSL